MDRVRFEDTETQFTGTIKFVSDTTGWVGVLVDEEYRDANDSMFYCNPDYLTAI